MTIPWKRSFTWLAVAGLAAVLAACATTGRPAATVRSTTHGSVEGTDDSATSGTLSWKGIPFARPPVGALRWKAPADPAPWSGVRPAKAFGNACVQYGRIYGPGANNRYDATIATTLNQAVGSEDCLYLNIWRPAGSEARLPVIVFVHGGSNVSGYTADPVYDGAALAKAANAVVVTVNYRLGIFGFLNLPQLKGGTDAVEDSGNFALLDCIKALRFVNRDIAAFGGDPGNVTLMGQSAGAIDVYALMASPLMVSANPRLFHRVVPLSGGITLTSNLPQGSLPLLLPASAALLQGNTLLEQQLIADGKAADAESARAFVATQSKAQIADYLRSRPPAALFSTLLTRLAPMGRAGSGPIPDGTVLAVDPIAAIKAGDFVKVPVLAGNTRDEARLFPAFLGLVGGVPGRIVSDGMLVESHMNYRPDAAPTVTAAQWIAPSLLPIDKPETGFIARTDRLNAVWFTAGRDVALPALKSHVPVWYYRFDWDEEPAPWNEIYGAAHLFDLPFVFGNFGPSVFANVMFSTANRPGRLALSEAMMQSLGAFARSGDPNNAALGVSWPTWPAKLIFDASPTQKTISVQ